MVFIDKKWRVIRLSHTLTHTKWLILEHFDGNHCIETAFFKL